MSRLKLNSVWVVLLILMIRCTPSTKSTLLFAYLESDVSNCVPFCILGVDVNRSIVDDPIINLRIPEAQPSFANGIRTVQWLLDDATTTARLYVKDDSIVWISLHGYGNLFQLTDRFGYPNQFLWMPREQSDVFVAYNSDSIRIVFKYVEDDVSTLVSATLLACVSDTHDLSNISIVSVSQYRPEVEEVVLQGNWLASEHLSWRAWDRANFQDLIRDFCQSKE